MKRSPWKLGSVVAAVSLTTFGTATAHAQDTTGGSVGASGSAGATTTVTPAATTPPPPPPASTTATSTSTSTTATPAKAEARDDGDTDHDAVVGHFAVGYLGVSQLPIAAGAPTGGAGGLARDNVNAPVIGVRYWLNRKLGLDLGFGVTSGSTQVVSPGAGERSQDSPSRLGYALHGGVPLAFANGKHYSWRDTGGGVLLICFGVVGRDQCLTCAPTAAATRDDRTGSGNPRDGGRRD